MAVRRQKGAGVAFSLAFLDVMSCGLGAVVLLFLIINHATEVRAVETHRSLHEEVVSLETEVLERQRTARELAASLQEVETARANAQAQAEHLAESVEAAPEPESQRQRLARLQQEVRELEEEVAQARERAESGDAARTREQEAQRQYLTGIRVEGRHILFLVDTSASMLAERIVEIIRRRNMSVQARRGADKWRRALAAVDWMTAQLPAGSRFQVYRYADDAGAVLEDTGGRWLETADTRRLNAAVAALRQVVPGGGSNLEAALRAAKALDPDPDAIYLVTDGLPTQGRGGRERGTVSPQRRQRLYRQAVAQRPGGAAVHVVLLPLEGDPAAASAYWQLARSTGAGLVSPSEDWP